MGTDLSALGIVELSTGTRQRIAFNTLGIDNAGRVVGGFDTGSGAIHAFLWVPTSGPWIDLHEEAFGEEDEESSFANAINDDGLVVGQYGPDLIDASEAWAWITDSAIVAVGLHSTDGVLSVAYDLSDGDTVAIVGETTLLCPDESTNYTRPFRVDGFDGTSPAPAMDVLPVTPPRLFGFAAAVVPAGTSLDAFGGESGEGESGEECDVDVSMQQCPFPRYDAFTWLDGGTTDDRLDPLSLDPKFGAFALAVNSDFDAVGTGWREVEVESTVECGEVALLWPSAVATEDAFPLGDAMPAGQEGDSSRAEGVGEREVIGPPQEPSECVRIVGWNTQAFRGTIWYGDPEGSSFCAYDLNELVVPCDEEEREFLITQAFEVNEFGHVAVTMLELGQQQSIFHAGLLTCAGDLTGDLRVYSDDLGLLLNEHCGYGSAGACTASNLALADLNCDGIVDGGDTGLLLVQWSGEELLCEVPCVKCEEQQSLMASDPLAAIAAAASSLGFKSLDEFSVWASDASEAQLLATATAIVEIARSLS